MRTVSAAILTISMCLPAREAFAQAATSNGAIGVWRGTSLCLVRPSACRDEVVVYRVTALKASDSLSLDARKIVNAQEEAMAILACHVGARDASVTCEMPNGIWHFEVRGDSLIGDLRLRDGTKFRDVRTRRSSRAP